MIYIRFSTVEFLYKKGVIKISGGLRFSKIKIGTCRIRCGILPRLVRFESHICCRIIEYIHKKKSWTLPLFLSITLFNCTTSLTHMISRLSKKNWINYLIKIPFNRFFICLFLLKYFVVH